MTRMHIWVIFAVLLSALGVSAQAQSAPQLSCSTALPVGQVCDGSITAKGEVKSYTISAQQNDIWYFRVKRTSGTLQPWIQLQDSANNEVCSTYTFGDYAARTCTISTSGAHTFNVADNNANSGRTGNYLVYAQRVNSPANSTPVAFGSETNADLAYGIEDDIYRFSAQINDKLTIRVRRSVGAMQPSMYVYDSAGNELCGSYTYNDYVGFDCSVTKTDTYFIIIGDLGADGTGSYTLHIQRRNKLGNAVALAYGVPHNASLSVKSEMDAYTFTAAANDQTFLRVKANSGNLQPSLYVYNQAGDSICGTYTYGTFAAFDCAISQAGVYNVIMDENGVDGTGDYTLYLQRTRAPGNAVALTFGRTVNGALEAVGSFDTYTFNARKNDKIDVSLARTAGSMTFYVGVHDPNGERVCYNYGYGTTLELQNCAITADGAYTMFVFDVGNDAVGNYTLALSCATGICGPASHVYLPVTRR